MKKIVIFSTLSTLPKSVIKQNVYLYKGNFCFGIHQQEPAIKSFLSENIIDKIVFLGSKETVSEEDDELIDSQLSMWKGKLCDENKSSLSSFRFLVYRLADFVYGEERNDLFAFEDGAISRDEIDSETIIRALKQDKIEIRFVEDRSGFGNGIENFKELLDKIRSRGNNTNLFMDIQGGNRSAIFLNSSLLQLIGKKQNVYNVNVSEIVSSDYSKGNPYHEIRNQEDKLSVTELFSGMDAFFNYGKADALVRYIEGLKEGSWIDETVKKLVNALMAIDNAIAYGRIASAEDAEVGSSLPEAISELKQAITELKKDGNANTHTGAIFSILVDSIVEDFGDILKNDCVDFLSLLKWRMSKNDIATSAIIVESFLPRYLSNQKLLYISDNEEEQQALEYLSLFKAIENSKNRYIFDDIEHYVIKTYFKNLGFFFNYSPDKPFKAYYLIKRLNNENYYYPIRVKIGWKCEIIEEIIARYNYISYNRNKLAHLSDNSGVQADLSSCINELIRLLDGVNGKRIDDLVYHHEHVDTILDSGVLCDSLRKCMRREIHSGYYGPFESTVENYRKTSFSKDKEKRKSYESLFILGPLLEPLVLMNDLPVDDNQAIDVLFTNDIWLNLSVEYYNESRDESEQITSKELQNMRKKPAKKSYSVADVINRIKSRLNNYDDFVLLQPHLASREVWDAYVGAEKEKLEKNIQNADSGTDDSYEIIQAVFKPLLEEGGWKRVVLHYCSDNEKFKKLLEIIKSPYAGCVDDKL